MLVGCRTCEHMQIVLLLYYLYFMCFSFVFFFTGSVLPELNIINVLKQLLCVNRKLISLSLLDWSEADCYYYAQYFTFSFYFYCVLCVQFHNKYKI